MRITLSFPESKAAFLFELLHNLKFISIEKEEDIPEWHKAILDERYADDENNDEELIDWEDIQKDKIKTTL